MVVSGNVHRKCSPRRARLFRNIYASKEAPNSAIQPDQMVGLIEEKQPQQSKQSVGYVPYRSPHGAHGLIHRFMFFSK